MTLALARWLLDAGAGVSARTVLEGVRSVEANDLREASLAARPRALGFALTSLPHGQGVALPMRPHLGSSRLRDAAAQAAWSAALSAARHAARPDLPESLPSLRLERDEGMPVEGPSIGLPAALAFALHYGGAQRGPWFATGAIDASGEVGEVSGMAAKLAIAAAEGPGPVFVPRSGALPQDLPGLGDRLVPVSSLAEALERLQPGGVRAGGPFVDLETLRASVLARPPGEAIEPLVALLASARFPADRVRLEMDLAARLRHVGRSADAHARAAELLDEVRSNRSARLGASLRAQLELHYWLGRMDLFSLDDAAEGLAALLARELPEPADEIRVRGALAQALGMRGDVAAAYALRLENLALHATSAECAKGLPGTLCVLAADAARLGDAAAFAAHVDAYRAHAPTDAAARAYGTTAWVRGSVLLGRHAEVVRWLEAESPDEPFGKPDALVVALGGGPAVTEHPTVSLVRYAVRARLRVGDADGARQLAGRVRSEGATLHAWLAALVELELAAGLPSALGDEARVRAHAARDALRAAHAEASAFHTTLLEAPLEALGPALDAVWY